MRPLCSRIPLLPLRLPSTRSIFVNLVENAAFAEVGNCRGDVSDGAVSVGDAEYCNLVPMPLAVTGATTAHFIFASGGVLTVSAGGFSCDAIGEPNPNFKERYEG